MNTLIVHTLQQGLDEGILCKEEFKAMCPKSDKPSKFYCNFKINKKTHAWRSAAAKTNCKCLRVNVRKYRKVYCIPYQDKCKQT